MFYNITPPGPDAAKGEINIYDFRTKAAADLLNLENALKKFTQPVKRKIRKIQGGCS